MEAKFEVLSSEALASGSYSVHVRSFVGIVQGHKYWIKSNQEQTVGETITLDMDNLKVINKETKSGKTIRLLIPRI